MTHSCKILKICQGYYDKNALANIMGLKNMRDVYRVTYDSAIEPAFIVHTQNGVIKFIETEDGVYAIDMKTKKQIPTHINQVNIIEDNIVQYSKRQRERRERKQNWHGNYSIRLECLP